LQNKTPSNPEKKQENETDTEVQDKGNERKFPKSDVNLNKTFKSAIEGEKPSFEDKIRLANKL